MTKNDFHISSYRGRATSKKNDELDANGSISWTRRIQNTSKNQFRYAEISEQNYLSLFAMRYLLMLKSIRLIVADPTIQVGQPIRIFFNILFLEIQEISKEVFWNSIPQKGT